MASAASIFDMAFSISESVGRRGHFGHRVFLGACGLASVSFLVGCGTRPAFRVDAVEVRLVAQDTSWHASYLLHGARGATEVATGREIHVPLGANLRLALTSRDYISDFKVPELGLRDFAAPDLPSEFRFHADRAGRYDVRGDELCGLPHTEKTRGVLVVEDPASFVVWLETRAKEGKNQ
jgi:heme/copper-type cytochrome/quinol oxidase subunit 2